MEEPSVELERWIASAEDYDPLSWERLPELELYMDQVITFMNRQLEPIVTDTEKVLTPSMINNYVKDGVLPSPVKKRYSKEHLAMLMGICSLKSVLSLPQINTLLSEMTKDGKISEQYASFTGIYSNSIRDVAGRLRTIPCEDKAVLYQLALQLALEANARHIAASRILSSLSDVDEPPLEKEDAPEKPEKEKKEKKSKKG